MQERSVESMQRMLDAGEELFGLGGRASLKLELILQKSGASTGSFYARFGGMSGFLDALHERALERLAGAMRQAYRDAGDATTLEAALTAFCVATLAAVRQDLATFRFFAVEQAHESQYRSAGIHLQLEARKALISIINQFLVAPSSAASKRRTDMVFRLILAMLFQQVMFAPEEVSTLQLSDKAFVAEWVSVLVEGLKPLGIRVR